MGVAPCPICNGTGKTVAHSQGKSGIHTQKCAVCLGAGTVHEKIATHMERTLGHLETWAKVGKGHTEMSMDKEHKAQWKFDPITGDSLAEAAEHPAVTDAMSEVAREFVGGIVQGGKQRLALKCADATLQFAKDKLSDRYPMLQLLGPLGDILLIGVVAYGMKTGLRTYGHHLPSAFQPKLLGAFAGLAMQGAAVKFGEEGVEAFTPMAKEFAAMAAGTLQSALSPGEMQKLMSVAEAEGEDDVA